MTKVSKILTVVLFFGLLLILPIATLISPKSNFSEVENRVLATFPECSPEKVKSQKYMKGIESPVCRSCELDWA